MQMSGIAYGPVFMHHLELGMHVATCLSRTAGGWLFKPCLANSFGG